MIKHISQSDHGGDIQAHPGDVICVLLKENGTTGYIWAADGATEPVLTTTDTNGIPNPRPSEVAPAIGAGGEREFTYQVVKTGKTPIKLKRWRPWIGDSSVKERFEIMVKVD